MRNIPSAASFDLNLAPMVDVMMCLLIFFMLATRMVEQEISRIDLPVARAAQDPEGGDRDRRIVINIADADGRGAPRYLIREEPRSLAEVLNHIDTQAQEHPDITCMIRADRRLPYGHIDAVLQGCARAGVSDITFGALRYDGAGP
ncbi:MAG TPA: biopolymer transporter ExbD [Phycisphaerae bacterium]|nr:biopolymer transporter ExbD [Phycisphaerae bacterium]